MVTLTRTTSAGVLEPVAFAPELAKNAVIMAVVKAVFFMSNLQIVIKFISAMVNAKITTMINVIGFQRMHQKFLCTHN
jgi:hypothetical protein